MENTPVIPTQTAWDRVSSAVKKVEAGSIDYGSAASPPLTLPARIVKVTGAAVGGFYPGKVLRWNPDTEAFVEVCDCYIKQGS